MLTCYPIQEPVRSAEPTILQEPVTLAEAKHQCDIAAAIEHHTEWLNSAIVSARQHVERDTGRVCYTGTFTYKLTDWPVGDDWFYLPSLRPITSITSIAYLDTAGSSQTLSTDIYALESAAVKPFVRLKYGQTWPALRGDINGITVTFVAGYASVTAVPSELKQAVLLALHVQWLLKNERPDEAARQQQGYERLIDGLRRRTYP